MDDVTRRNMMRLAVGGAAVLGVAPAATAAEMRREDHHGATVEFADVSAHGTVALRAAPEVAHFADLGGDPKTLMIAVVAGLNGWTVGFTTTGADKGFWKNVKITAVHKK